MNARKVFVGLWLTVTLTCWAAATPLFASNTSMVVAVDSNSGPLHRLWRHYADRMMDRSTSTTPIDLS